MRRQTCTVSVGDVKIGSDHPIRIQSMTTSSTRDIGATIDQIKRLADSGCEIARVTVQGKKEALACEAIKNGLLQEGYSIPLVADIHFYPPAAMMVAEFVDKVRINPGNYLDKRGIAMDHPEEKIDQGFSPLVLKCKERGIAMRIGVNHGSLAERMMNTYGDTPDGMVASALEYAKICRKHDFHNFLFSMKSSNTIVMIDAYRKLVAAMDELGWDYPLHLGVTESGRGLAGRVKSAVGIGSLLLDGIGDTIRVSLTEDPWHEIGPCKELIALAREKCAPSQALRRERIPSPLDPKGAVIIDEDMVDAPYLDLSEHTLASARKIFTTCDQPLILRNREQNPIWAAAQLGALLIDGLGSGICMAGFSDRKKAEELALSILQACRMRHSKTEFISCPSCGRTLFDLQEVSQRIEAQTSHLPGVKIAIMGCIVNGPGEMADADFGYVGSRPGKIDLYVGKTCVEKNIDMDIADQKLIDLIKAHGRWVDS